MFCRPDLYPIKNYLGKYVPLEISNFIYQDRHGCFNETSNKMFKCPSLKDAITILFSSEIERRNNCCHFSCQRYGYYHHIAVVLFYKLYQSFSTTIPISIFPERFCGVYYALSVKFWYLPHSLLSCVEMSPSLTKLMPMCCVWKISHLCQCTL